MSELEARAVAVCGLEVSKVIVCGAPGRYLVCGGGVAACAMAGYGMIGCEGRTARGTREWGWWGVQGEQVGGTWEAARASRSVSADVVL